MSQQSGPNSIEPSSSPPASLRSSEADAAAADADALVKEELRLLSRSLVAASAPAERALKSRLAGRIDASMAALYPLLAARVPTISITGLPEPYEPPRRRRWTPS